ncbi:hypothetical protein DPEC_G00045620 [Dallia pectoralis]|uniref:Uncharacterized protein n=1 Tax=Dallia pectoralis TaxID=75939 RepID=A0ACC2H9P4_DALPE|nr:hypothetical protein DPEC_G00045620 [Dallia pectoralis]
MDKRLIQIIGFMTSTLGWLFVLCTTVMDYWRVLQLGTQGGSAIIKVAWYWSTLWKDCYSDSTAVSSCRDFPLVSTVTSFIQRTKALLFCGLSLGFLGALFCFVGMECTYIGGGEKSKDKILFAGSLFHFVGGVSDIAAYCLYINKVARMTFATTSFGVKQVVNDYGGPGAQPNMAPLSERRTVNTGYYRHPRQDVSNAPGRSSNSRLTRISQVTPENLPDRDAFV